VLDALAASGEPVKLGATSIIALACVALVAVPAGAQSPLDHAHAHNDYVHARPLLDALDRGFGSVEADVFLVDGALLVAHARDSVRGRPHARVVVSRAPSRMDRGARWPCVRGTSAALTLLIDAKADAEWTWVA